MRARRLGVTIAAGLVALGVAAAGYVAGRVQEREELMPVLYGLTRIAMAGGCTIEQAAPAVVVPDIEAH